MPRRRLIALGWGTFAGFGLAFINPFGIQTVLFSLGTLTSPLIQNNIQEWASPDFHSMAGLLVEGIIFLLLAGLATGRVRARTSEWLLAFALLYLALSSQRHVPLFVLAAAPLMARCAQALLGVASSLLPAADRRAGAPAAPPREAPPPGGPPPAPGGGQPAGLLRVGTRMSAHPAPPHPPPGAQAAPTK